MGKNFAIVGNGWRAEFFLRIAAADDELTVCGVLCRSEEKAQMIADKFGVFATTKEQDILDLKPDFIVVSVSKNVIVEIAEHWRKLRFVVLCETPVGLTRDDFAAIKALDAPPLIVAEQYQYYETYAKMIEWAASGKLGDITSVDVSLAHDYHGASLIRHLLGVEPSTGFKVMSKKYELPVTKTGDRFYIYDDGEIITKIRNKAFIEFDNGKIATYDFDSEQYHSLIRHNSVKITGTRGEIIDEKIWYLDENNKLCTDVISDNIQSVRAGEPVVGLTEDERAIRTLLVNTALVADAVADPDMEGGKEALEWAKDNLENAIVDAYFMILFEESKGNWIG